MTGAETAAGKEASGFCDTMGHGADHSAPVAKCEGRGERAEGASPLRERMVKRVAYWRSLRTLSDEQEAALEFWEAYLKRR